MALIFLLRKNKRRHVSWRHAIEWTNHHGRHSRDRIESYSIFPRPGGDNWLSMLATRCEPFEYFSMKVVSFPADMKFSNERSSFRLNWERRCLADLQLLLPSNKRPFKLSTLRRPYWSATAPRWHRPGVQNRWSIRLAFVPDKKKEKETRSRPFAASKRLFKRRSVGRANIRT